jgi:hypothetical protein
MNIKDVIVPYKDPIPTRSVDSVLPVFYREILKDLTIDEGRFLVCVEKYVRRTIDPNDIKEISSIRGNLKKELLRSVMTWKVFIKGLQVINVRKFDLALHVEIMRKENEEGPKEVAVVYKVNLDPKLPKLVGEVTKTDSLLAMLFKDIMFKMGVNAQHFMRLIADYIFKANIPANVKEISSTRGNLKKELFKSSITWKVFIKGLSFLHVKRFTLGIYLHHHNGKVTEHKRSVNLDDIYELGV